MTSFAEVILSSVNPFDNVRSVNFWHQQEQAEAIVDYIYQEAFVSIEETLNQVIQDHGTRTVLIEGDSGSGKTYLLGRLKKQFSYKAFFVSVPPFPQRDSIWRHILRYTFDTLIQVSEDKKESTFLSWLSVIKQRNKDDLLDFLRGERQKFISKLKEKYKQENIHHPELFFGLLYDLTNPDIYPLACDYLRGYDLSEDALHALKLKRSIDTETSAREILSNFGLIFSDFQPLVICFDQIYSIGHLPDGSLDIPALFNVNAKIHEEDKNILIIISILTNTWKENKLGVDKTFKASIDRKIELKEISLAQAEILLASKLHILHSQSNPQPPSPIYPLNRQILEKQYPQGKTTPRELIIWARGVFQAYKEWLTKNPKNSAFTIPEVNNTSKAKVEPLQLADFRVKWREEFTLIQRRITHLHQLSSPELIQMLNEIFLAFGIERIVNPLFVRTKYASYSIGFKLPGQSESLGIVWSEDPNMTSFQYVMEACRSKVEKDPALKLFLIRAESLGVSTSQAFQAFEEVFVNSHHRHITPTLVSVHYLATFHSLARDAREGDLVVDGKIINLKDLWTFINVGEIFHDCTLLQSLGIVKKSQVEKDGDDQIKSLSLPAKIHQELSDCKTYIFNLVTTQSFLSRKNLIQNASNQFLELTETQIDGLIQQLCWENKVKIIDPKATPESQLVCLFPKK